MSEVLEITALPHQEEFIYSTARHTGLVAGFGAGKSKAGTIKIVAKKLEYLGIDVAYYLPTYGLIDEIAVPNIKGHLIERGVAFDYNDKKKRFSTAYGDIIMRSMNNPENIIGYEVGYSLIDEADVLPKEKMRSAFIKIVARNRVPLPDGSDNCIDLVSTPEGFEFMYDFFVKSDSKHRVMIKAKTSDNPFLPPGYIETLEEIYTKEEMDAYLGGEFVNLKTGTVHHTFDRMLNHSDREIAYKDVLHVGMDFNITNMSAVVHVTDGPIVTAVGEVTKEYDTASMASSLTRLYDDHSIIVYPDMSGSARNTAGPSDFDILKRAGLKIYDPKGKKKNPSVRDRITRVNAGFLNAKGERTYMVNTNNCPEYTEALEKLAYDKHGAPDKTSGFDHLCDGGGYCYYRISQKKRTRLIAA